MQIKHWRIEDWQGLLHADLEQWACLVAEKLSKVDASTLRATIHWTQAEAALRDAGEMLLQKGDRGPLAGVPYALKDLFDLADTETTCGSGFHASLAGMAHADSEIVTQLKPTGAVCALKTSMNEFAYGLSGENATYGNCPHPRFPNHLTGGSSSGSAWAVGRGIVPFGIGTDTGGSIRVPSAWCGLLGLRLTPGYWMQTGAFPLAPSFDTAGWITANSRDMLYLCDALLPDAEENVESSPKGLWVEHMGLPIQEPLKSIYAAAIQQMGLSSDSAAVDTFREACRGSALTFSILQSTEAAQVHKSWLEPHKSSYDPKVWGLIDRGRHWTPEQQENAVTQRSRIRAVFEKLFQAYDYIALPAVHQQAPTASELAPELRDGLLTLTSPASLAGLPVLTLPLLAENGLSGGIQIILPDFMRSRIRAILDVWQPTQA